MTEISIWAAAKKTIKVYLSRLREEHKYSDEQTTYDVCESSETTATFVIHNTIKELIDSEIKKRALKKIYGIVFLENDSTTWKMRLEAHGYESYVFAGMLSGIVEDLDKTKEHRINTSKDTILATIVEVLATKEPGGKFYPGIRYSKGIFYASLRFKNHPKWEPIDFEDSNVLSLISKIAKDLPKRIEQEKKKQ